MVIMDCVHDLILRPKPVLIISLLTQVDQFLFEALLLYFNWVLPVIFKKSWVYISLEKVFDFWSDLVFFGDMMA